jgi:FAD binding domain
LRSPVSHPISSSISQLRAQVRGRVITPDDPAYDQARGVFYGGFDRHPAVIIRPVDAGEVARVLVLARHSGLELAVRSGGHSLAGHNTTDDGIVLDLRDMNALDIDPQQRTAWAQTGLTALDYTTAAAQHGLATGFGDTGSVGIGGITLGGGIGYLVRKHGLTIDSLLAAEVVTADGQLLRADAQTHPDLFWALRGGGGNFGVATRFQFRLHPVSTVVGGLLLPATPRPGPTRQTPRCETPAGSPGRAAPAKGHRSAARPPRQAPACRPRADRRPARVPAVTRYTRYWRSASTSTGNVPTRSPRRSRVPVASACSWVGLRRAQASCHHARMTSCTRSSW